MLLPKPKNKKSKRSKAKDIEQDLPYAKSVRYVSEEDSGKVKERAAGMCELCMGKDCNNFLLQEHHIKSRGSGGGDEIDNQIMLGYVCHRKAHDGNVSRELMRRIVQTANNRMGW